VARLALDMASIGQGYTAGRLADLLERNGSTAYLAEIGGEVVARGLKPDGSAWRIGIENPVADAEAGPALRMPPEARTAVVTSGSYRHYFEADGRRFGHIIDPRTGSPVEHALVAVTVVGNDGATAGAWGTALLCLGAGRSFCHGRTRGPRCPVLGGTRSRSAVSRAEPRIRREVAGVTRRASRPLEPAPALEPPERQQRRSEHQ
jgi:thiamine biosynthesis lipoprotein